MPRRYFGLFQTTTFTLLTSPYQHRSNNMPAAISASDSSQTNGHDGRMLPISRPLPTKINTNPIT